MLPKELVLKLFDVFNMKRWNDYITPVPLMEMDKQAHKMIIAYVIAKIEVEEFQADIDYTLLIEGAIIETLHRSLLTDLRPSISHQLMQEKREELNSWIMGQLEKLLPDNGMDLTQVRRYLEDDSYAKQEKKILAAAHFLSTHWEFQIIKHNNKFSTRLKSAKQEINRKYIEFSSMPSVQKILLSSKLMDFVGITAELRFQERWAQAMRIPKTNVLGHMYFVSILSYFMSKHFNFCDKRLYNNFFVSLFHDLPEVMIRDIASPIKIGIEGLDPIVKEQEKKEMKKNIYPLLPKYMLKEFRYFIEDEFSNRIYENSARKILTLADMHHSDINDSRKNAIDGQLLKVCDDLAAFLEATLSIEYGIKSKPLIMAREALLKKYATFEFKEEKVIDLFQKFNTLL